MTFPRLRFKGEAGQDFPEWEEKTLGEISDIKRGASPRPISDKKWFSGDSKIGWVRISDVSKSSKYLNCTEQYLSVAGVSKSRLVMQGNIIMSICATIGKPIYTNFDVCIHDGFVVFENLKIDHEYLYYYLMLIEKNWYQYGQPGSQVNLNSEIVSNETISIPVLKEQTKIANFLTAVDAKIHFITQKHDLLTQYKKSVMQQIFSQELRFKDDDGQDLPEWEESTLEEVSINYYQGINTAADKVEYIEGGVPIIQAKHITGECLDFSDVRGLSQSNYDKYKEKYNPKVNDLLISNIGTLGKVVLVESEINFLIAWNIFKVTLNTKKCYPRFIREFLKKIASDGYFDSIKTGNATKFINKSDMLAIKIAFPCQKEQTKIANFLTAIDDKITATQTQLQALKQYKQGLLQQMFV